MPKAMIYAPEEAIETAEEFLRLVARDMPPGPAREHLLPEGSPPAAAGLLDCCRAMEQVAAEHGFDPRPFPRYAYSREEEDDLKLGALVARYRIEAVAAARQIVTAAMMEMRAEELSLNAEDAGSGVPEGAADMTEGNWLSPGVSLAELGRRLWPDVESKKAARSAKDELARAGLRPFPRARAGKKPQRWTLCLDLLDAATRAKVEGSHPKRNAKGPEVAASRPK